MKDYQFPARVPDAVAGPYIAMDQGLQGGDPAARISA